MVLAYKKWQISGVLREAEWKHWEGLSENLLKRLSENIERFWVKTLRGSEWKYTKEAEWKHWEGLSIAVSDDCLSAELLILLHSTSGQLVLLHPPHHQIQARPVCLFWRIFLHWCVEGRVHVLKLQHQKASIPFYKDIHLTLLPNRTFNHILHSSGRWVLSMLSLETFTSNLLKVNSFSK